METISEASPAVLRSSQAICLIASSWSMVASWWLTVAASVVDAYQWLSLAVAKGLPDAVQPLSELKQKMITGAQGFLDLLPPDVVNSLGKVNVEMAASR